MIVLVTGCRSGFGKLIAIGAARAGHTVYAGVRDPSASPELTEGARGLSVIPIALDVTDAAQREEAIARIVREQGRLDALVNNAGVGLAGFQEQVATDELQRLFEVNVVAPHALTRLALPHLRASKGIVINVSSMAGRQALPGLGAYAASKFALEGMTEALRHEMRPFGVRVVLVEPGPYQTDIFGRNRWTARAASEPGPYHAFLKRMESMLASAERRMGDPQEVAELAVRLLSDPRPRLRYALGPGVRARLLARSALPFEVTEAILARVINVRAE
ncbi:SDR family oxidoreductase [Sandaracinus amylolyticus]|uniref:3-oxoacyl-[acyl-carrier protein] reductase n=1 Tax=Sandaracinus amylolyticus TaxID=927083 RepID=A0A0F6VZH4_9BACT|nr:SDR family oxidoreductase [Sandaracinus amylolyticus]AKF03587.1 3-oxoacyl-[acyl-carrier protein] reductase [Sandaracinus amylolyticus]